MFKSHDAFDCSVVCTLGRGSWPVFRKMLFCHGGCHFSSELALCSRFAFVLSKRASFLQKICSEECTHVHTQIHGCVTGHSLNGHDQGITLQRYWQQARRASEQTCGPRPVRFRPVAQGRYAGGPFLVGAVSYFFCCRLEVRSAVRPSGWALPAEAASLDFNGNLPPGQSQVPQF